MCGEFLYRKGFCLLCGSSLCHRRCCWLCGEFLCLNDCCRLCGEFLCLQGCCGLCGGFFYLNWCFWFLVLVAFLSYYFTVNQNKQKHKFYIHKKYVYSVGFWVKLCIQTCWPNLPFYFLLLNAWWIKVSTMWFNYMIEAFHVITFSHRITLTQILRNKIYRAIWRLSTVMVNRLYDSTSWCIDKWNR